MDGYPETIFDPVSENICKLWKSIEEKGSLYGGYCNSIVLKCQNRFDKTRIARMRCGVKRALQILDLLCANCDGNHSLWWLGGGAAAYWVANTTTYNDYNLYVCCSGYLKSKKFKGFSVDSSVNHQTGKTNVLNIETKHFKVQVMPIAFQAKTVIDIVGFQDFFATYVLVNFDIPACRVAVTFHRNVDAGKHILARCVDASFIDLLKSDCKPFRLQKYEDRHKPHKVNVGSLSLCTVFSMIKSCLQ